MKTLISVLALLLSVCNVLSAQITKAELQVAGLTCSMCSKATDKQLRSLDFVEEIDVDLSHASFILHFKKDKQVDLDQIRKKVEAAGFSVALLKPTYLFSNLKVSPGSSFTYGNAVLYFAHVKEQTLNGEYAFQIIDSGFVSAKEGKKYVKELSSALANTVKGRSETTQVYHIIL
jgi:copper chaperone CopZ